jgi:hypothetical protein
MFILCILFSSLQQNDIERKLGRANTAPVTNAEGEPSHKCVKNITFLQPAQVSDTLKQHY